MKFLVPALFFLCTIAALAEKPDVANCFKVHALVRMDGEHYWADWTNTCPYTIDSVYVLVNFSGKSTLHAGDGMWPMYFVAPGTHRVTRFSVPSTVADFESVNVRKITADPAEALRPAIAAAR